MATVPLRLRGVTPLHLTSATISALPLGYATFQLVVKHAPVSPALLSLSAIVALLPWVSRAVARATYRAKLDDIAIHVRGEALPYKTITELEVRRTPRRTLLILRRGETVELHLVLRDAYAGRLEPLAELAERLARHGHAAEL